MLKDPKFRQALQWAVDKNKLCAVAYGGMAKPADTVITANYYRNPDWHWTPPADQAYSFNLAKASQMLTAAGYKLVNGVRLDQAGQADLAAALRPQQLPAEHRLRRVHHGLVPPARPEDHPLDARRRRARSDLYNTVKGVFTPNYDMFEWGWYNDVDPGPSLSYFTTARSTAGATAPGPTRSTTRTYKEQSTEMDQAKRLQLVYECQQIIYQQSPYIPLAYSDDTEAWNTSRWTGWVEMPAKVGNVVFPPYGFATYLSVRPKTGGGGTPAGPHRRAGRRRGRGGRGRGRRALRARQARSQAADLALEE